MNIQEKLKNLITKHKSNPAYDAIVNDLCRLYFEIEEQEKEESPFEGFQLKQNFLYKLGFKSIVQNHNLTFILKNEIDSIVVFMHDKQFYLQDKNHSLHIVKTEQELVVSIFTFFGVDLLESKEPTFISNQCLLDLGFTKETSNKYFIAHNNFVLYYNTQTKEISLYDNEEEQYITLPKLYHSISELKNLLNSL